MAAPERVERVGGVGSQRDLEGAAQGAAEGAEKAFCVVNEDDPRPGGGDMELGADGSSYRRACQRAIRTISPSDGMSSTKRNRM